MARPRFLELVRVSSQAQAARDSPEDQRRALEALRASRPGVLVERIDSAVSGAKDSDDRADLARLFALAEAKAFDELRCRHVDRLTRHDDPRERFAIYGAVADAGAIIVDAAGHVIDPKSDLGEMDYYFQTLQAARERRRILERTLAARKRLAGEGKIQGRPPFARTWDKKSGAWGVDEPAMALYRRLYSDLLAGLSLAEIAAALNRDGAVTPLGREWTPAHVSRLVRARSAIGIIEGWGRIFRCPPVVDEATWKAAQRALARHRQERAGPPGHHPALLRRVLVCGVCGSRMWVQRGGRTGDVRSFYVCRTHRKTTDEDCRRWHPVETVDENVRAALLEDLRRPATMRGAAGKEQTGDPVAVAREDAARAAKELADLDKREERLARLTTKGAISERVGLQQLQEIAKLRATAEAEHASATARVETLTKATAEARDLGTRMQRIAAGLERSDFAAWREYVVAQFPPPCAIRLYPDGRIVLAGLRSFGVGLRASR